MLGLILDLCVSFDAEIFDALRAHPVSLVMRQYTSKLKKFNFDVLRRSKTRAKVKREEQNGSNENHLRESSWSFEEDSVFVQCNYERIQGRPTTGECMEGYLCPIT